MRLFTAIEAGDDVRVRCHALIGELRERTAQTRGAKLTWVDSSRIHLTVRFIGEVDESAAMRIRDALSSPIAVAPFEVVHGGLVAFPTPNRPRVIACGVRAGGEEASAVEVAVGDRLAALEIPREARKYRPHMTLVRVREAGDLRADTLFAGLEDVELGTTRVEAITLFESRLSPKGPTYAALMRTPLAA